MKTKNFILALLVSMIGMAQLHAQDPSAIADFESTTQGVLVPRMLETERTAISMPATGLLVYQTDGTPGFYYNYGSPASPNWKLLGVDNDNDPTNEIELPAGGSNGQVLTTNGAGVVSWENSGTSSEIIDADGDTKVIATDMAGTLSDRIEIELNGQPTLTILQDSFSTKLNTSSEYESLYFGYQAGQYSRSSSNIGIGDKSLANALSPVSFGNVGIGAQSSEKLGLSGYSQLNVSIGFNAGQNLENGTGNVILGSAAVNNMTRGDGNVFIGGLSGVRLSSGHRNTFIGADQNNPSSYTQNQAVKIGYHAGINDSTDHVLHIGNTESKSLIYGRFNQDYLQINDELNIAGEYSFPTTDGVSGQILSTDGAGQVAWTNNEKELPVGGSAGQYLQTDGSNVSWQDITLETDLGIGTSNPISEVHIKGNDEHSQITIAPIAGSSGDSSSIFLAEDDNGDFGMSLMYDGIENKMTISGKSTLGTFGPHVTIKRDNGDVNMASDVAIDGDVNIASDATIDGYTQLGLNAPKIRMKKLTLTTGLTEGATTNTLHGINAEKILAINAIVKSDQGLQVPNNATNSGCVYNVYTNSTKIYLKLDNTNSENILSKTARIIITYEE